MSTTDAGWHVRPEQELEDGESEARQAALDTVEVDPADRETVRAAFFDGWDARACWEATPAPGIEQVPEDTIRRYRELGQ